MLAHPTSHHIWKRSGWVGAEGLAMDIYFQLQGQLGWCWYNVGSKCVVRTGFEGVTPPIPPGYFTVKLIVRGGSAPSALIVSKCETFGPFFH